MKFRALTGACAVAALGACAALPAPASGATFDVIVCKGSAASGTAFETLNAAFSTATCPPVPGAPFSGLVAQDQLGVADYPTGTRGGFTITAQPGTTITQVAARRYFGKRSPSWQVAVRTAQGQTLDTCNLAGGLALSCSRGVDFNPQHAENLVVYPQLSTSGIEFGFTCQAPAPEPCNQDSVEHHVWMVVYDATVTIDDPALPVLGQPSGVLLGPGGPGGWHKGPETVSVRASDASGIKRTAITIGASRQSIDQVCDYTRPRPCPPSVDATHAADLNVVADGRHQLRVGATDAAGQEKLSDPVELKVDSHAPLRPNGMRAARNKDGSWRVSWVNPPQGAAAPIVAARYAVCRPAPSADCPVEGRSVGVDVGELNVRRPQASGRWDALVWLEDEAANQDRRSAARVPLTSSSGAAASRVPRLRITAISRKRARLRVTGRIARAAKGTVAIRVRARRGGHVLARGQARVRAGRWRISARLPRALRGRRTALVTVTYRGDRRHARQTITRRVGRP
ncbi:MAG: hypothetical protein QOI48_3680 [Solirubrobacteraceae bacterium]|nr:hypothetical protein [Solirubrobacteraceae bacterium]